MKKMPAVMIFPDANCNVIPRRFYFDPEDGESSFYNMEDMMRQDLIEPWAGYSRAVMVPPGFDLTLYGKEAWRGYHEVYNGKAHYGETGVRDLICQPLNTVTWNYFKSLKITKRPSSKITGYWKGITSSEGQDFTFTVGISSTNSKLSKKTQQEMLKKSFDQGFEASVTAGGSFGSVASFEATAKTNLNISVDSETESEVSKEISSAAESNQSMEYTVECKPGPGETMAGLRQWVISTSDYNVAAFTPHTVCRTGKLAFQSPQCPFMLCDNHDCSVCKGE